MLKHTHIPKHPCWLSMHNQKVGFQYSRLYYFFYEQRNMKLRVVVDDILLVCYASISPSICFLILCLAEQFWS